VVYSYLKGGKEMKCCSTADRLKEIMQKRNLKQVDILNKSLPFCSKYNVKMNKSDISQYVSGKVEPSQEKLVILGMALGVTEAWLMGFDVSPMRKDTISAAESDFDIYYKYSLLDDNEKEIVIGFIDSLLARKKK
jgi:transcriptional regulator with XRE-family HTH domain